MKHEFICHSTDRLLEANLKPKGRIYKSTVIYVDNSRYFVNDINRSKNLTQYSLLRVIKN